MNQQQKRWGWRYGNIAEWRIARAFGMAVLAGSVRRLQRYQEPGATENDPEALFREADIVSLHLSSGPHSDGLVNAALLNSMKPGAADQYLSRGGGRRGSAD